MRLPVPRAHPALRARRLYRLLKAGGRPFDGNLTSDVTNWMFPTEDFSELPDDALETLMERTVEGNLSWVIFPPQGFRL